MLVGAGEILGSMVHIFNWLRGEGLARRARGFGSVGQGDFGAGGVLASICWGLSSRGE
jgi:hypothetical protein